MIAHCDFCPAEIDTDTAEACAWMHDVATNWMCERCAFQSERDFQISDMMRDVRESEITEMEGADL